MIKGKGLWIWKVDQLLNVYNSLEQAVEEAVRCGTGHALVKIVNGWYAWMPDTPEGRKIPMMLDLLRSNGIQTILWTYSYCHTIPGETRAIREALDEYGDGESPFIIDVEKEYKKSGSDVYYETLTGNIRATFPNLKIGHSSYRFPSLHQDIPWGSLTENSDFAMPQVYWEGAHNPAQQLQRSWDEYRKFSTLPFYPAGAAYTNKGWKPTDEDLDEFSTSAHQIGIQAINYWRWDTMVSLNLWDTFCRQEWGEGPPPQLTDKQKLDILWAAHPELHPSN